MNFASIVALCAIVFGVVIRFYWAKARGSTHDTWYHLHIADRIRREQRLPDRVDQFLIPGPYDYPPGLHLLLAVFPSRVVSRFNWLFAPFIEIVHIVILIGVTYWLAQDLSTALVAGSIYATYTTQIVQFTVLTPRVLGSVLVSVLVLLVFYGFQIGAILPFVAAVGVGVVLLHTHKMSSQTVLFIFLFLSLLWIEPIYVALIIAMVMLSILVSGGHYLTILRGHISIINFWRRQHNAGRSPGEFMRRYGIQGSDQRGPDSTLVKLLTWVKRNEWTTFVADNSWTFLLGLVLVWGTCVDANLHARLTPFVSMTAVWAIFILGFAVLTQHVPYFKLVGDGYKYFMWGAFPTSVVLAVTLPLENTWVTAGYSIVLVGSVLYGFVRMYLRVSGLNPDSRTITTDGKNVIKFIENSDGKNVLLLPFGMSFHLLYETDLNILFHQNPKIEAEPAFPVPIDPLEDIVTDYEIDYVVIDTTKIDVNEFDTESFEVAFEDAAYLVLELE
jgi:hypothetical protein